MILYHATTKDRADLIREQGLLVSCADPAARIKGAWLHTKSQSPWAILHTMRKHKAQFEHIVILKVSIPRLVLTRFKTGLWYTKQDVMPEHIVEVISSDTYAASRSE